MEEDNDVRDNDNNNEDNDNDDIFFAERSEEKMLREAKQTPAEQLALLSRASGVQF